ncbi:unnamed protein product [Rotaria magnacalcarata]|uniref:Glycoside hydrolase family 125 protein n=1 Tax=Rotaria magnacalcarata TaxID=392030 RepID=A0A8S2PSA2_9BILA|nr:unnamed protein product [Rotaria magnacalcarata]
MYSRGSYNEYYVRFIRNLSQSIPKRKISKNLLLIYLMIGLILTFNILFMTDIFPFSSLCKLQESVISSKSEDFNHDAISTIERSKRALEKLKVLLASVMSPDGQPWIWIPTKEYPSVPYQPTFLLNQTIPKPLYNITDLPRSVVHEINRVCRRLKQADQVGGAIWCKLFKKTYSDTLVTTTTILDDKSTYIITGDIDLMWLRDSSAQVHQYLTLWQDLEIQRIVEGLICRQIQFIFSNPYASAFRLTLRPNPPSDDSLEPIHVQKGRNLHVAMHNYELDSLCYHIVQLHADILSGINTYGIVNHENYGKIYAFETDGFSQHLLIDDANIPSLLSATYLGFKTPYDPSNLLMQSTRQFILSKGNPYFFQGKNVSGIGSQHTAANYVWPMAIIMEGLTTIINNNTIKDLDYVWQRLEASHAYTFSMHESFDVNNPTEFTREWFAWVNSLFAELVLTHLEHLEDWLCFRRTI